MKGLSHCLIILVGVRIIMNSISCQFQHYPLKTINNQEKQPTSHHVVVSAGDCYSPPPPPKNLNGPTTSPDLALYVRYFNNVIQLTKVGQNQGIMNVNIMGSYSGIYLMMSTWVHTLQKPNLIGRSASHTSKAKLNWRCPFTVESRGVQMIVIVSDPLTRAHRLQMLTHPIWLSYRAPFKVGIP